MKHYKDENNQVYAYESDGSQDAYILPNLVPIPDEELAELRAPKPLTVEEARIGKIAELTKDFNQAMSVGLVGYTEYEISSFAKQEAEARSYLLDATAPVPLLNALAQERSLTLTDLCTRIIAKADQFAVFSGTLIGKLQHLTSLVELAPTVADVDTINW